MKVKFDDYRLFIEGETEFEADYLEEQFKGTKKYKITYFKDSDYQKGICIEEEKQK